MDERSRGFVMGIIRWQSALLRTRSSLDMNSAAATDAAIAQVCQGIAANGHAVVADFLPAPHVAALAAEAGRRAATGEFGPAGIGHGERRAERSDIRGDRIVWLDEHALSSLERALWNALDALRVALNRVTFLGLFTFEGHYALYSPGAFYRRHRDVFLDDDTRVLSCVLYLNEAWTATDGGALRIHLSKTESRDVTPVGGTLVCFLAERYEHEVLPAKRERLSMTGWFRRRSPG
jgi:SM-20-related protein